MRQRRIAVGVHPPLEQIRLMIEVALDVEEGTPEPVGAPVVTAREQIVALVREHREFARQAQASNGVEFERFTLQRIEGDPHRTVVVVRADDDRAADALRCGERPLQRAHAAERSADREREMLDSESLQRATLRTNDIADGNARKRLARRAGRSIAAPKRVDADDAPLAGIEERTVSGDCGPPIDNPARSRKRVLDQHDVRSVGRGRPVEGYQLVDCG